MSYFPYFDASHDYAFNLSLANRLHVHDSLEANNFNTFESERFHLPFMEEISYYY